MKNQPNFAQEFGEISFCIFNSLNKKTQLPPEAPLIACISEVAPPPVCNTTTKNNTDDTEDYETDQVLLRDYPSLNKETLLFFIENTHDNDPVVDYHDFVEDILETIAEEHLCTIEALPEPSKACFSAILAPDGLCKRGPKCRYVHTLRELREQWLVMYRTLIASVHNPRNDLGSRSPYPKQAIHVDHNPPTEFKQQPNRQFYNANTAPRDNNPYQSHYSNKQPTPNNTSRTSPEPTLVTNNPYAKSPAPRIVLMLGGG